MKTTDNKKKPTPVQGNNSKKPMEKVPMPSADNDADIKSMGSNGVSGTGKNINLSEKKKK